MKCCELRPNKYDNTTLNAIDELRGITKLIETDGQNWTSVYACQICNTRWLEINQVQGYQVFTWVEKDDTSKADTDSSAIITHGQ